MFDKVQMQWNIGMKASDGKDLEIYSLSFITNSLFHLIIYSKANTKLVDGHVAILPLILMYNWYLLVRYVYMSQASLSLVS